jgi:DNA-binding MarR family transcriptional regulator
MSQKQRDLEYYEALLNHIKTPSIRSGTGIRTAALEHLVLGSPQSELARKHGVAQSNLNRLIKRIRELDAWVGYISQLRASRDEKA